MHYRLNQDTELVVMTGVDSTDPGYRMDFPQGAVFSELCRTEEGAILTLGERRVYVTARRLKESFEERWDNSRVFPGKGSEESETATGGSDGAEAPED